MGNDIESELSRVIRYVRWLCNIAEFGMKVAKMPNCNDCGNRSCEYKPAWGESVRYNCPLYVKIRRVAQ